MSKAELVEGLELTESTLRESGHWFGAWFMRQFIRRVKRLA